MIDNFKAFSQEWKRPKESIMPYAPILSAALLMLVVASTATAELTIEAAQEAAITRDSGIPASLNKANAVRADAVSKAQLPDPTLILGALNFPTDSFQLDQEPMTQLKVGVKQMFPQGDTLALQGNKLNTAARVMESNAAVRYLNVSRAVRKLWLEVFYWQQAYRILKEDEALYQQLLDVTHSLYSVGNVQQHDVLRAELELSRLQEKIIKANSQGQTLRAQLSRWVGNMALDTPWPKVLPILLKPQQMPLDLTVSMFNRNDIQVALMSKLEPHPILVSLLRQVDVAESDIKLAQQKYDPSWGVELSYSYRDGRNANGTQRSDFMSAMVNVSLPLFASQRQDKTVQGAAYNREAMRNAFQDKRTEMMGEVQTLLYKVVEVEEQLALFDQQILSKARQQAESSLTAYQADASNFGEVMRAYISEQRDRIDYERLLVSRLQLLSELHFYFPSSLPEISLDDSGVLKRIYLP